VRRRAGRVLRSTTAREARRNDGTSVRGDGAAGWLTATVGGSIAGTARSGGAVTTAGTGKVAVTAAGAGSVGSLSPSVPATKAATASGEIVEGLRNVSDGRGCIVVLPE
jgi:hypothetical protein